MIQTFLVSGAAGALGMALTQILLGRGHRVIATDIDQEAIDAEAKRLCLDKHRLLTRALDVTQAERWEALLDEVCADGPLDVLIQCAGVIDGAPLVTQGPEAARAHLEVNALGVFLGTQAAAKRMVEAGRGHIINVASMAALMPSPGFAFYAGSKYAVRGFSLAAAEELKAQGVDVTVVCPATVDTPMYHAQRDYYEALQGGAASAPMSIDTVVGAILHPRVLRRRPKELHIPPLKGALARGIDLFPGALSPVLTRLKGRRVSDE